MTKKIIALCLCLPLLLGIFAGCGVKENKATVLCTVFPIYDWVKNIVGDSENVEIKLLLTDGADLHSYQPTAMDAIEIKEASLVVRVGGADDSFVNELTKNGKGADLRLMEAEGVTLRRASSSSAHTPEGHSEHQHAIDEHIWLSPRNAAACVRAICASLCELYPDSAQIYRENTEKYLGELRALDERFDEAFPSGHTNNIVVADRFPFVYLTEDYGIGYEAAFEGCTTDAEADFDTIIRLSEKLKEWNASRIFVTESSDRRLASAVAEKLGEREIKIAVLNSMQAVSKAQMAEASYIGIMENNLAVLTAET